MKTFKIYIQSLLIAILAFIPILGQASPAHAAPTIESFTTVTNTTWVVPTDVYHITYLVVGGGGGGGTMGGGGAGGYLTGYMDVTPGNSLDMVVGDHGHGATSGGLRGGSGTASKLGAILAAGGGGGGAFSDTVQDGIAGGSGGGGGTQSTGSYLHGHGGAGDSPDTTPNQGSSGGDGVTGATAGGGGGGSGAVGGTATANTGGNGGVGTSNSITGSAVWYAAGGGGAGLNTYGNGGSTGAGHGGSSSPSVAPTSADANTGSGGGGAYAAAANAGNGGTGIVVLSYTPVAPITVTSNTTTSITTTGALLNGNIMGLGGFTSASWRGFQYDVDTGAPYATNVTSAGTWGTGAFSQSISSLSKGTLYYFRAQASNTTTINYGSELTFLTLPDPPAALVATRGTTEISFTWSKGSGAGKTMIRRSTTTYPTTTATGSEVYLDTGTSYVDSGLTDGTTYYYSAWSEITTGGITQYSSSYAYTSQTPGAGTILPPDTLEITSASVFTNFRTSGDQLYILTYKCIYTTGDPAYTASDFFNLQLLDGDVLKAQVKMPYWGYRASSIYLAPGSGLVWGSSYKLKIIGTPSQWTIQPNSSYSLQSYDWKGADMTQLDSFVITSAQAIATYYATTYTQSVPGYGTILNATGGTALELAIPGLSVYRPLLFETGVVPIVVSTTPSVDVYGATRSLTTSLGPDAAAHIATFSAFFGQTSQTVSGWIVVLFAMLLSAIVGMSANNMGVGAFAGLFIIIAGVILGAPAMAPVWAVGSVFVIIFFLSVARGV